jgi:hypothetical protein
VQSWFSKMPPPAATQAAARLWTQPTRPFPARNSYRSSVEITRTLCWQTRFTRWRVRARKSGNNSVTVHNRTHVYMNFFDHKDLENHLLQLCHKVLKHPVYACSWHECSKRGTWSALNGKPRANRIHYAKHKNSTTLIISVVIAFKENFTVSLTSNNSIYFP